MATDWLIGDERARSARERLLAASIALIGEKGVDGFDLAELARRAHCSRATVYRHTGGRSRIIEDVLTRTSQQLIRRITRMVDGLNGAERVERAVIATLEELRADAVTRHFLRSSPLIGQAQAVVESEVVLREAVTVLGLEPDDHPGASFAVRAILAQLLWSSVDSATDAECGRFIAASLRDRLSPVQSPLS